MKKERRIAGITKKTLTLVMIFAIVFTLIPIIPGAGVVEEAEADVYQAAQSAVYVSAGNELVTNPNYIASGSVTYATDSNGVWTLTLKDFHTKSSGGNLPGYGIVIDATNDIIVEFVGTNDISVVNCGIKGSYNTITMRGNNIKIESAYSSGISDFDEVIIDSSDYITIVSDDSNGIEVSEVEINGGKVNVSASNAGIVGRFTINKGDVTISSSSAGISGNAYIKGGTTNIVSKNGIYGSDIYVSGGNVNITSGNVGIYAGNNIVISGGVTTIQSQCCGAFADDIYVINTGKISSTVTSSSNKTGIEESGIWEPTDFYKGKEYASGMKAGYCITAARYESAGELVFYHAAANGYTSNLITQSDFESYNGYNYDSATDVIFAKSAGKTVTLYGPNYVEDTPVQSNTDIGFAEKYVKADDGTLLPESEVYKYNDQLHQKEVSQIQESSKDWRVVVRTKLGKKGIKTYAYLNGRSGEELDKYIASGKYTIQYDWYRTTNPAKGYKYIYTTDTYSYYNTAVEKGKTYYYMCKISIFDEDGRILRTQLSDCTKGYRTVK